MVFPRRRLMERKGALETKLQKAYMHRQTEGEGPSGGGRSLRKPRKGQFSRSGK